MSPVLGQQAQVGIGYAVPGDWGAKWRAARNAAASTRTEVAIFGDSTTWGANDGAGNMPYSWVQRLRDRLASAGYTHGGKGVFGFGDKADAVHPFVYTAPEVNGAPSAGWTNVQDSAYSDILVGEGFNSNTAGQAQTLQGYITGSGGVCRIWYTSRSTGNSITYTVNGGAGTTTSVTGSGFLWITGLPAGANTIVVTNNTANYITIAAAFMNANGVVFHKFAKSGQRMLDSFDPFGHFSGVRGARDAFSQQVFGLVASGGGNSTVWQQSLDTTTGAPRLSLAILHLSFNDMSNMATPWNFSINYVINNVVAWGGQTWIAVANNNGITPGTDVTKWAPKEVDPSLDAYIEGVHLFCRLAQAAGADPLVINGETLQNPQAYVLGGRVAVASRAAALACGAAWCDFMLPALGAPNNITGNAPAYSPHLQQAGYQAQADFLWDKVLSR